MTSSTIGTGRVEIDVDGPIGWIVLDNGPKRNAMSAAMWRSIPNAVASLATQPEVRAIVVRGNGPTFCSGADISELGDIRGGASSGDTTQSLSVLAEQAIVDCPVPTIALIEGYCVGGGCQLALACDLRIASPGSQFGITPAKLGIVYPPSSVKRLTATVGSSAAKLLLFTASLYSADRALSFRLLDEVVEEPESRVRQITDTLTHRSLLTIAASKELVDLAAEGSDLTDAARRWSEKSQQSGEAAEGIAAFLERRDPVFPFRTPHLPQTSDASHPDGYARSPS